MATDAAARPEYDGPVDTDLINYEADDDLVPEWVPTEGRVAKDEIDWDEPEGDSVLPQQGSAVLPAPEMRVDSITEEIAFTSANPDTIDATGAGELDYEEHDVNIGLADPPADSITAGQASVPRATTDLPGDEGGEITYDEDDGYGATASYNFVPDVAGDMSAVADAEEGAIVDVDSYADDGIGGETAPDHSESSRNSIAEVAIHTGNEELDSDYEESPDAQDPGGRGGDHAQNLPEPDISVTYKDEEYPLFHGQNNIDTQMGFFEDRGVLDAGMDALLSSFRDELEGDLSDQDELVFQVDELGLEYAESTHRDSLSSMTVRKLYGIFDQLVKNQFPEESRTLYTYLVIRPNVSKRLEYLVEEAFNGKGLDDISFRFRGQGSAPEKQQSEDHEDDGEYDDAEGGANEDGSYHQDGAQSQDIEDSDESPENLAVEDDGSEESEEAEASMDDALATGDLLEADDEPVGDDNLSETNDFTHTAGSIPHENSETNIDSPFDVHASDMAAEEGGIMLGTDEVAEATNAAAEDNALNSYEIENFEGEPRRGKEDTGFEFLDLIEDEEIPAGVGTNDKVNSVESRTTTLHGEDEIDYEDEGLGDIEAEPPAYTTAIQPIPQNMDDLDWSTLVGQGGDINELGKRSRPEEEDELAMDAEKDVKRRRSG